jgi:hypothetical protein
MSHRSHEKRYILPLVEVQNLLNDLVTNSPHSCRVRPTQAPSNNHGGRPTKKRPNDDPMVDASKRWLRGEGLRSGGGRGRGGGHGGSCRTFPNTSRIDFNAIAGALTSQERKRYNENGLCFKCHKKGHRVFECPELKGKEAVDAPTK